VREPRGIRNNNPLNIEAGPFTQRQPGFAGSDGRFARFQTPEQGVGAASNLLDVYQTKHGLNTIKGIVNRWAPPGENNSSRYADFVARQMGVHPEQPLQPEQMRSLVMAMGLYENGRPIAPPAPQQPLFGQPQAGPQAAPPQAAPALAYAAASQQAPQAPQTPQRDTFADRFPADTTPGLVPDDASDPVKEMLKKLGPDEQQKLLAKMLDGWGGDLQGGFDNGGFGAGGVG
jgi:hypothetical protein